jgi:hypothetical protein
MTIYSKNLLLKILLGILKFGCEEETSNNRYNFWIANIAPKSCCKKYNDIDLPPFLIHHVRVSVRGGVDG